MIHDEYSIVDNCQWTHNISQLIDNNNKIYAIEILFFVFVMKNNMITREVGFIFSKNLKIWYYVV